MTEYRRAAGVLEALEGLVASLVSAAANGGEPTAEERQAYVDARAKAEELAPTADKMRTKVKARAELEALKESLRERLPGAPQDAMKAAQELIDEGGDGAQEIAPALQRAHELESVATYGAKMVEKVQDLLERFDKALGPLQATAAPRLDSAVASAAAEDQARREAEAREAAAQRAEEERRAEEEARMAVAGLMAENEERLQAQQAEEQEAEQLRRAKEEAKRQAEAWLAAEEEALLRAEQESELRLAEVGPDEACGEALAAMLAAPVGPYRAAVEALVSMIGGVAAEPEERGRRLLRVANEGFQQQLGRRPGVWLFLRGAGFEPRAREALPSGLLASLNIGGGPPSERFLLLTEPNMMEAYEEWLLWHTRIKEIAAFLEALQLHVFARTASLGQQGLDVPMRTVLSAREVMQSWEARGGR